MKDFGWRIDKQALPGDGKLIIGEDFSLSQEALAVLGAVLENLKRSGGNADAAVADECEKRNLILSRSAAESVARAARMNVDGFGVLDLFLDKGYEEVSVTGINNPIRVYDRKKGWLETNACFTSEEFAVACINKMARPLGRRVTYNSPRIDASLPNGSRLHASIAPVNLDGVEITIRNFPEDQMSIIDLVRNGTLSAEAAAFLWACCQADASVLVAGNTGSGKTTLLNSLFSFVPLGERVIVTEDTPEIRIPHRHVVRMIASPETGTGLKELVGDTLRMRPDRVIVGEVRNQQEAGALFDSLLAGQAKANYATFHAQSCQEALNRLKSFGIPETDMNAIDAIIAIKRISVLDGTKAREIRRVTQVCETRNGTAKELFGFNAGTHKLEAKRNSIRESQLVDKLLLNYKCTKKQFLGMVRAREGFINSLRSHKQKDNIPGFSQLTKELQEFAEREGNASDAN